jgi:hypothetical protein
VPDCRLWYLNRPSGWAEHGGAGHCGEASSDLGSGLGVEQVVLVAAGAVWRARLFSWGNEADLEARHAVELEQPDETPGRCKLGPVLL